jgi:hypothetical protein
MPSLRHTFALMAIFCCLPACRREVSPFCPKGTFPVALRSEPGKTQWCESDDKHRAQWLEWHPGTTHLRQSCGYYQGKPEGSFTAWHPNGKTWVEGQFANGLKVGKWKQWDAEGNVVAEGDYSSGRLVAGAPVAGMAGCEKAAK